ncbi:hypothetical protein [Sphingobacterium sp.]|uniref:hypothetical protein n=1 Tax=Sphingobacterium sp. TaxID=341027 RepID=UPI0031E03629
MKSVTFILFILMSNTFAAAQSINQHSQRGKNKVTRSNKNYTVTVADGNSRCQILINDVPLVYYEGSGERSFLANSAILNSGEQTVKIVTNGKIPTVTINETYNKRGEYAKTEIWKNNGVLKGNFTAEVPYSNIGWDKSRIISKDSAMFKEANIWFQNMSNLLEAGKGKEFMKFLIPAERLAALMYNLTPEETARFHSNWISFISRKAFSLVPLSDCEIEIVGNGRLFHLTNNLNEGGFALVADNGQILFLDIYLHVPTASSRVEPILANFKQITSDFKRRLE